MAGFFGNMIMGKSNRPDFTPDMMPKNRMELFFEMLKVNFWNLIKVNLLYLIFYIPFWFWLWINMQVFLQMEGDVQQFISSGVFSMMLLGLIPCLAVTGPAKASLKYITRNWARDDHAWIWSDFWDVFKANWKQGLAMSSINAVLFYLFVFGVWFYNTMAASTGSAVYMFLQALLLILAALYGLTNLYIWPMMVTYNMRLIDIVRNSVILTIGRLPFSVLFGLISLIPVVGCILYMPILLYYVLVGYALTAFINVSYTNSAFDKYLNSRIEGAAVGQGLRKAQEEEYEYEDLDEEEDEERK